VYQACDILAGYSQKHPCVTVVIYWRNDRTDGRVT